MRISIVYRIITIFLILAFGLSACNLPRSEEAGKPDVTQVYQTVEAKLTQSAELTPAASPTDQPTATAGAPSPTAGAVAPTATSQPPASPTAAVTARQCDQAGAGNPIDVTIPDDTQMTPGQKFVKTWRLVNSGTCTWTTDYSIAVFSGESMGASGVQLSDQVLPGESIDVSVDLTAPTAAGTYQGNWKMRNAAGAWFGIGPSGASPFWVKITVSGTPAPTTTTTPATPTATTTPGTPTPTGEAPGIAASGSVSLAIDNAVDLDNGIVSGGGDLLFKINNAGREVLSPQSSSAFAIVAKRPTSPSQCQSAGLSGTSMPLRDLGGGMYICYQTDEGRYGYLRLLTWNEDNNILTFDYLTWD